MDRDADEMIAELFRQTLDELRSELQSLESSSEEFTRESRSGGPREDLKEPEIPRLRAKIAEYELLLQKKKARR